MKIELHIPGLLAVPARLHHELQLPEAPALQQWCRQAVTHVIAPGRHGFIAHRLAMPRPPLAALAWRGATGQAPEQQTFFATPVHLRAGMDDLVLFGGAHVDVAQDELDALAHDANAFFGGEPALRSIDGTLFMQVPRALDVSTTPVHAAQGERVRQHLPAGADAAKLHAWMNELQMFLHGHELNRRRTARGLPVLNGLWVWGEGSGEPLVAPAPADPVTVHARSPALRGLAALLGAAGEGVRADGLPQAGEHIVELDDCVRALDADDSAAWRAAVARIATGWLAAVLERARHDATLEAVLYPGDGTARRLRGDSVLARLGRAFRRRNDLALQREE